MKSHMHSATRSCCGSSQHLLDDGVGPVPEAGVGCERGVVLHGRLQLPAQSPGRPLCPDPMPQQRQLPAPMSHIWAPLKLLKKAMKVKVFK